MFPVYDVDSLLLPGCHSDFYAPMHYDDGGIDGDMIQGPDGRYYFYYKDSRAPNVTGLGPMQQTSGTRIASTANLGLGNSTAAWSAPQPKTATLLGPYGTEAPEIVLVNNTLHMYFDCSFHPTPTGRLRAPYGVATANNTLSTYADPAAWTTASGSCTGNDTSATGASFPDGATHGGFVCVDGEQKKALLGKWGPV